MAKLSTAQRKALPASDYVFPERAPGPGSYPIPDKGHAEAALEEVSVHGTDSEKQAVRAAVRKKFGLLGPPGA